MHAYAGVDPVFLAMNRRAQRESNGELGDFCVRCHAPMAVRDGLTTDGLNLAELPAASKGVTCYFCHSVQSVDGTHNNPLGLATDGTMFAAIADPVPSAPHRSSYGKFLDSRALESATACGACHDIQNTKNAHVERTFQEWQASIFSVPPRGLTCAQSCHASTRQGPASTTTSQKVRTLHGHTFASVDVALTDFPEMETQRQLVQDSLNPALQSSICLDPVRKQIEVVLDNAGTGHGFPSGATPDRRAWAEVTAYAGETVIYQSGHLADGQSIETLDDPDLWLIRDCIYGSDKKETHFFWEAEQLISNQLPASVVLNLADPLSFTKSHIAKLYPSDGASGLPETPDRITLQVHVKAIGDDILADLVASGDLDPAIPPRMPTFQPLGATLEWTRAASTPTAGADAVTRFCVAPGRYLPTPNRARSHARCPAPM
jgi:hypothetical protein